MSPVIIGCIAYICAMNLFIGLYIGRRGSRWFIGIGLVAFGCGFSASEVYSSFVMHRTVTDTMPRRSILHLV